MNNKLVRTLMIVVGLLIFAGPAAAQMTTWQNDAAHSGAYFQIRFMKMNNIRGSFRKMTVNVQYDPKDVAKTMVDATIDAASIDTDLEPRDKDLRGPTWFDVEKFPTLTFKSKSVAMTGGTMKITGDLTLHGVTKSVTLDVDGPTPAITDDKGATFMGATAITVINRKDFGITANPGISDEVLITLELDLKKAAPAAAGN
jgi:polyisoprenoid-binding protein YceI